MMYEQIPHTRGCVCGAACAWIIPRRTAPWNEAYGLVICTRVTPRFSEATSLRGRRLECRLFTSLRRETGGASAPETVSSTGSVRRAGQCDQQIQVVPLWRRPPRTGILINLTSTRPDGIRRHGWPRTVLPRGRSGAAPVLWRE